MKYAKVAVEAANYSFDMLYTYLIPPELSSAVKAGCRVTVPFGQGNRKSLGIVMELTDFCDAKRVKKIYEVQDPEPLLTEEMIMLSQYIAERTFCTVYDGAKAMLPAGINYKMVKFYAPFPEAEKEKVSELEGAEKEIYQFLLSRNDFVREDLIFTNLGLVKDITPIESLLKKKLIISRADAIRNLGDLTAQMVAPVPPEEREEIKLSKKQQEVLNLLDDVGSASVKEVCYFTGFTPAVVKALVKNGGATLFECFVDYFADLPEEEGEREPFNLSEEQQIAADKLIAHTESGEKSTTLLYGVTGSGKTSVYMSVIDKVFDEGKSAIILVPEIGLTPQAFSIFRKRYGTNVAVFHSALSIRERSEQWKRVNKGEARVVVGTRSAIFAPVKNLGLIIIDEEQEHTYKSEQTPRYDAIEIAKFRSAYHKCPLVLASATPRVESYANALEGNYDLCTLTTRYGNAILPDVLTVDMRRAEKMKLCTEISKELYEAINNNLSENKQSILLINRRGYNTFAACDSCGKVISCPNCSISMTYHSANNRLLCHYCGYSRDFSTKCPECNETAVRYAGYGTQRIEDGLEQLFPDAKILRMDADTTNSKDSHEKIFSAFEKGEYDILLGTQMVAKGLDFPNVTLVGVISVDHQLYNDDFRSLEKTFSLLTQVVGRSGRGESKGSAIIQTLTPENEIIRLAANQDYDEFYNTEIIIRKALVYPPYCDLCVLGFSGLDELTVKVAANEVLNSLKSFTKDEYKDVQIIVLGPVPARVLRVSGKFRYRIIIKCRNSSRFREMISKILKQSGSDPKFKKVSLYAAMNPDTIF